MRELSKFKGCLIGGAVGDALGYAVEFISASAIFKKYGENGITEYALRNGIAEISDDTQMALFTATGLLLGITRGMTRGIMGDYAGYIAKSYSDWYKTQTENTHCRRNFIIPGWQTFPKCSAAERPGILVYPL